jgi:WD40 repeat protein
MRIIQSEYPRPLNLLAIGPNGLVVAASKTFGTVGPVEAWDATTGACVWHIRPQQSAHFRSLYFVLDGTHLLIAEETDARFLALSSGEPTEVERFRYLTGDFAAVGNRAFVVVGSGSRGASLAAYRLPELNQLWRDGRGESRMLIDTTPAVDRAGTRLAYPVLLPFTHPRREVSVCDTADGRPLARISLDPTAPVRQLAFSADGSNLIVCTDDRTVRVFSAETGAPAGELVHRRRSFVTGIAVHPRGPVACARTDGTVTFWDAEKCAQLRTLDWKAGRLVSVAFSPDGALAAAGTEDGKVIVWDVDV